ncbi:MAG: DnaB-like helicase C-terminal domain-containing protein [Legionellales bacterium]|jgi:replicative DNA helicase
MEINVIPFCNESECEIIGSMLCDKKVIAKVLPILSADDFYIPKWKEYYTAISKVFNTDGFPHHAKIKDLMNVVYPDLTREDIEDLTRMRSSVVSIMHYAKKVKEYAAKRNIIHLCDDIKEQAYKREIKSESLIENISQSAFKLSQGISVSDGFVTAYEIGKKIYNEIDDMIINGTERKSILTNIAYFDTMTNGLRPGQVMILAASTSAGKTAMAANIALDVAQRYGKVVYFSYEMTPEELIHRLIAYKSGIIQDNLWSADLTDQDRINFSAVLDSWANGNLMLDNTKCPTVELIKSRCRNLKMQSGLELIVIDYISQIPNGGGEIRDRISKISREIKLMAMELQVPVLALSQLNRMDLAKPPRRPQMYNLKETSSIEQDADIVALLYRPGFWGEEELIAAEYNPQTEYDVTEMTVVKNRSGKTGKFKLKFNGETSQFYPYYGKGK